VRQQVATRVGQKIKVAKGSRRKQDPQKDKLADLGVDGEARKRTVEIWHDHDPVHQKVRRACRGGEPREEKGKKKNALNGRKKGS